MPTTNETGCLIGGSWGQYASARLIELAYELGWENMDATTLAKQHLDHALHNPNDLELIEEYATKAEEWLNTNHASPDHAFGWLDGEFYYLTKADWNGEI